MNATLYSIFVNLRAQNLALVASPTSDDLWDYALSWFRYANLVPDARTGDGWDVALTALTANRALLEAQAALGPSSRASWYVPNSYGQIGPGLQDYNVGVGATEPGPQVTEFVPRSVA